MKNIENLFNEFVENITLTPTQREDAKTKYEGVIDCLAKHYYDREHNSNDMFLFGSYKTKTHIRPLSENSDVDVLFRINQDIYDKYKDNPSGLLQDIRKALKETYTTTDKISAWGKVVLVKFADGHHNVEVLPALENEDGAFTIPNTCDGGSWEDDFNPREQVDEFQESNRVTNDTTRSVVKMIKRWACNTSSMNYKSFLIVGDVIDYLSACYPTGKEDNDHWDEIVSGFFTYIKNHKKSHHKEFASHIDTAQSRAIKAVEYRNEGKYIEASEEWRKIFGDLFPKAEKNEEYKTESRVFQNAPRPWYYC